MSAPFSAIICTFERTEFLKAAVASVLRESTLLRELWIMDQSASDDSERMVSRTFADARIRYARASRRGKSRSANLAAAQASGDYLAFTDDDCQVAEDWLSRAWSTIQRYPGCNAVVGAVAAGRPDLHEFFDSSDAPTRVVKGVRHLSRLGVCGGLNMFVSRKTYLSLGGQDECLGPGARFPAAEDLDLFYRLLSAGHAIVKDGELVVRHFAARLDSPSGAAAAARDYARGTAACYLKHLRCGDAFAAWRLHRHLWDISIFNIRRSWRSLLQRDPGSGSAAAALFRAAAYPVWIAASAAVCATAPLSRSNRLYSGCGR